MDERICVSQVIQEFVPQALSLVCSRYKSCYIQKLNGNRPPPIYACTIIRFATVAEVISFAGAIDLQIPDGTLRVNGCEAFLPSAVTAIEGNGEILREVAWSLVSAKL